jgi:hypothetical protein
MKSEEQAWQKLVTVARSAPDERSVDVPYGFSTRVVAAAWSGDRSGASGSLFERWSWRALTIAGMFAAVTVVASYTSTTPSLDDDLMSEETAVASLLDHS